MPNLPTSNLPKSLLIIEDDQDLARLMSNVLIAERHSVEFAHSFNEGLEKSKSGNISLVLLDVMLPGGDGFSLCRSIRRHFQGPILMVTARGSPFDEVMGLDAGADDYLVKPVAPEILLARIRAHLRRDRGRSPEVLKAGPLKVSSRDRSASCSGKALDLSTAEFDTLWELAKRAGTVVSRDALSIALAGVPFNGSDRTVDIRVSRLRQKLKPHWPEDSEPIKTIHGEGYLLGSDID